MIEIKFTGDNFSQLRTEVQEFAIAHLGFKFSGPPLSPEVEAEARQVLADLRNSVPQEKRGPGRPKKTETIKVEQMVVTKAPVAEPIPANSYEDCVKALKSVWDKFGLPKAMECLQKFNVDHAKKLTPEQWPAFVSVCVEAVN